MGIMELDNLGLNGKNVVVVGASYAGKNTFLSKVMEPAGYKVFSLGEILRGLGKPHGTVMTFDEIAGVVRDEVLSKVGEGEKFALGVFFRTPGMFDVLRMCGLDGGNTAAVEIDDSRIGRTDFPERPGRPDDSEVLEKRRIWNENRSAIMARLSALGIQVKTLYAHDWTFDE